MILPLALNQKRLKQEVERQLDDMLATGIVQESNSPMASPLVCVLKGRGGCDGVRLAVDYRYVNSFTVGDAFPISDIEDVIQRVGGKRFISTFDCRQGYYQTRVCDRNRWLTAFVCMGRLLEFVRTPFGLKNAGQTFVRAMHSILRQIREFTDSYIDDCAVFSDGWHDHLEHLDKYLSTMRHEHITINLKKCRFGQHSVKFCGEIIGSGTRSPDPEKVAAVKEIAVPETKKQLRGMLGFFSYFRKHIKSFADKAKVLTDLTSKRVPQNIKSVWTDKHSEALRDLKDELIRTCNEPLYIVRFDRPFHVYVDASSYAVAGYVVQCDDAGVEHPVAFFSSKLSASQTNWSTIEREAYAALLAVKKYREWLFGSKIIIHSDHNPLTFLTESAPKSSKLVRWNLALAEYNIEFKYHPGKLNTAADSLSRPGPEVAADQSVGIVTGC